MTAHENPMKALRAAWSWLRQVSGDAAYENYVRCSLNNARREPPLSREEFYMDSLRRRYSTVSRCC